MTSRERTLTALKGGKPDMVPFLNEYTDIEILGGILGFDATESKKAPRLDPYDETSFDLPSGFTKYDFVRKMCQDSFLAPRRMPPLFVETQTTPDGKNIVVDGKIKTREDLKVVKLPKIDEEYLHGLYEFVEQYRNADLAIYFKTRMGPSGVLNSMGLNNFAYSLIDDPELPVLLLEMYAEWCIELLKKIQEIEIDFLWFADDLAFNTAPMFSPDVFREIFLPTMRKVVSYIKVPWVYHTDGNVLPIMEDLLSLGMNGLNPLEPGAMDIEEIKQKYGKRLCLIGNIDLHYTLTMGTVEEVETEVKNRIASIGKDGGFILSSANSLPYYCKLENVIAMRDAFLKYRKY